ncbi:HSF-type DNA-binding protein [Nitzschia inconspicua]|uniref:HSF-type DNA-binding protein n=1 Tax=Nitzschia inconspicua TaxID=303405 RepID=A0A9K3L505_9STRA|nr:HSF-type DNA-binding protein [Nitzschia inconspicua]
MVMNSNPVVSDTESECKEEMTSKSSVARSTSTRRSRASRRPTSSHHHHQLHAKHYVEHNYHDHKYDPVEVPAPDLSLIEEGEFPKKAGHKGGVSTPFPEKLHELLETVDQQGDSDICGWQPHGRCFIVHKPKEFVSKIMPQFFKQSKLTSFQRQLNLYGFSRLTAGCDRGGYYHELFIRGRKDLCTRMLRTRVKGNGSKAASSPSTEPNFYHMEPCLPGEVSLVVTSSMKIEEERSPILKDNGIEANHERVETPEHMVSGFDLNTILEEDPVTPVSNVAPFWDDSDENDLGVIDLEKSALATEAKFTCLPPVVTPGDSSHRKIVVSSGPSPDNFPPMLPIVSSFGSIPPYEPVEDIHSGDKVFFEGLPFHYLEMKDIEESLVHGEAHFV